MSEKYLICDFNNSYVREPVIRKMNNGTLICLLLTGGPYEPHNENVTKITKSYDNGKTWTKPEVLFSHPSRAAWSTELFVEDERSTIFLQTYNADSYYHELQSYASYSCDNGESWSEPISLPNGLNGVSIRQGITLSNSEHLFPLYYGEVRKDWKWENSKNNNKNIDHDNFVFCCGVALSKDKGKTFERYGYIKSKKCLWEPNCVELEPGHIIMFMRSNNSAFLGISHSFDYGRTWSEFKETSIPNPNTKVTLVKVKNLILLINNFNDKMGMNNRNHLQIHLSDDLCNTWKKVIKLEDDEECYFYPHAFYDETEKMLYVAYENAKQCYLKKITLEELSIKETR